MLGNDIIDIAETKRTTNWQRKGFLEKIFSVNEQDVINKAEDPFTTVWRMWSMKESAYKIYIQEGREHAYNPSKFKTSILDLSRGQVQFDSQIVYTITDTNQHYISTVATVDSSSLTRKKTVRFTNTNTKENSIELKHLLLTEAAKTYGFDLDTLKVKKTEHRVPHIYHHNQKLDLSLSLSHHGQFGAYSFSENQL